MRYIETSSLSLEENLSVDLKILEKLDEGSGEELLRTYLVSYPAVVLGISSDAAREARQENCRRLQIPILRRESGGGTVLLAPGCLAFSLYFRIASAPSLFHITSTHTFVLQRHAQVLQKLTGEKVTKEGLSDLAIRGRKVSGNAQRRKRHALLYHGTFLLSMNLNLVEETLHLPARQPPYRKDRSHLDFLRNLHIPPQRLQEALRETWGAEEELDSLNFT